MSVTPNHTTEKTQTAPKAACGSQSQRPSFTSAFRNNLQNQVLLQNRTHILGREDSLKTRLLGVASDPSYQRCGRWLSLDIVTLCTCL